MVSEVTRPDNVARNVKEETNKFFMMTSRRKERREKRKKETRKCSWTAKGMSFILRDDWYGFLNLGLPAGGAALHYYDSGVPLKPSPSSFQSARFYVRRE